MGGKKKKSKKKDNAEKGEEDPTEKQTIVINLPVYGWIRVEFKLCDPPDSKSNTFKVSMKTNSTVMDLK
jgi:hypothetical protein